MIIILLIWFTIGFGSSVMWRYYEKKYMYTTEQIPSIIIVFLTIFGPISFFTCLVAFEEFKTRKYTISNLTEYLSDKLEKLIKSDKGK